MEAMINKAITLKPDQIKAWLTENACNTEADMSLVFDAMLAALEQKINEAEFVSFVEKLEALM